MTDSAVSADDIMRSLVMDRTGTERLRMCAQISSAAMTLALAGMWGDVARLNPLETRRRLLLRFYGKEFTASQSKAILEAIGRTPRA